MATEDLKVLYKSNNFIIVNKNHDLIINSEDDSRISLHRQLVKTFPYLINKKLRFGFYFPHRLDYSTSGVMCIALSKKSCAAASLAFQEKSTRKYYLALVRGHVSKKCVELNNPIGERNEKGLKIMSCHSEQLLPAHSKLLVLERGLYESYPATKILLRPLTGRRHQLRVHCHAIGHTIIGDYTYSQRKDVTPPRMFLHSYRLIIPNDIEMLDLSTEDPFTEISTPGWLVVEKLQSLDDEAIRLLEEDWNG
ncbi:hypothetical protein RUM43_011184 [Polyplax serrata]|uniref:Pseudouridine synthase RsuA/RluA-like domain-containing protein n=1 Tax=Polyplax serrata TaxID=468196 RepID=A0AAN8P6I3_POLSC